MNETRVRALVPIIIIVVAIGVGVFFGVRYMPVEMGSGTNSLREIEPDPISAVSISAPEQAPELTTEPNTEKPPSSVISAPSPVIPAEAGIQPKKNIISPSPATPTPPQEPRDEKQTPPSDDKLKNALTKAADSEDYAALGTVLAEVYKRYPQGKKEFAEIESRAYVKATGYLDQEKNVEKARAAAEAVYSKYPFGWRFKYLRVRVLERLGRDAFAAGDLASAEKHALAMLGMEFRPEGANLMADIYLKRIDAALAKGDKAGAQAAYDEIKDYQVSPDRRKALDERLGKIRGL